MLLCLPALAWAGPAASGAGSGQDIDWWAVSFGLAGGLAIFLFGIFEMSDGLKRTAGSRLRSVMSRLTGSRLMALLTGTLATMIAQSSSAISVLTVGMVQARLLSFARSVGILLGAGIGTTITAQLIAFKLTDYALLFVAVGYFTKIFSRPQHIKQAGDTLFGFGLLFFGMSVMSNSMAPLRSFQPFIDMLISLENPVTGILAGFVFTALVQSSSAFIGILIVLASQGLLSLEAGIPLLLGANIGTTATANLAALRSPVEAKRVAMAFSLIKIAGVLTVVGWIPYYAEVVRQFSPGSGSAADITPRQIANAHTLFNVIITLVLLPFTNGLARLVIKILPEKPPKESSKFATRYLDNKLIDTPAISAGLAKAEALRMAHIVEQMLEAVIKPFLEKDTSPLKNFQDKEDEVDYLRQQIARYSARISQQNLGRDASDELFSIMYTVTELEEIADILSKTLQKKAREWADGDNDFSAEGKKELADYHAHILKQYRRAVEVFRQTDPEKAEKIERKHRKYREMADELKRLHFERLSQNVPESVATSKQHMEVMGALRIINSHLANIGRIYKSAK